MERDLRKWKSRLVTTGKLTIVFCLWNIIKTFINLFLSNSNDTNVDPKITFILNIVVFVIMVFIVLIHLFVGFSAISEGKGKKTRYVYLVVAFIMAIINIVDIIYYFFNLKLDDLLDNVLITSIISLSFGFILIEMIASSIIIKVLNKRIAKENM